MDNFCCILLYFTFWQIHFNDAQIVFPSSNFETVDLLGLFPDAPNTSKPTTLSVHSRAMFKAAILLSQQYNITISGKYIGWEIIETYGDVIQCFSSTCRLLPNSSVVGIVGPAYSRETEVLAAFAGTINLPVISYSATNTDLSDRSKYSSFFRTVSSDEAAALAITSLFLQYNWTSCIIIYQNDAFGTGGAQIISESFNDNDLTVLQMILFNINTLNFQGDLQNILLGSSARIVILWADETYTPIILQKALDVDVLGPQFTWILSSNSMMKISNKTIQQKLIGFLIVEPVIGSIVNGSINTTLLNAAINLWQQYEPESFPGLTAIDYYAYFAFDATWSLIEALQQYCSTISNNSLSYISFTDTSFCFDRYMNNGNELIDIISTIELLGVSGQIKFSRNVTDRVDGIYYVAKNVQPFSDGVVTVPVLVWNSSDTWQPYVSTSVIIWPGNTLIPPNGLASMLGVKLRVAVILADPFTMIMTVVDKSGIAQTQMIGYIPDLIDLLVENMGFIPQITVIPENQSYNSLVDAVANGIYDVVIADVTITSQRSERVSFSNSIFDNSLRVIIRKKTVLTTSLLAFLNPLSLQLWMVLLLATICAGLLVCLFERSYNEQLQNRTIIGSIAISIYYSFGNIVGYGAGFDLKTSAGRLITVALYTLSIVIVATYTANLASDLTVMKSQDIISGIDDIKNGKVPLSRIGIVLNSSIDAYYLREISNGLQNYYPLIEANEIYPKLIHNVIDAAIMDAGVLEYVTTNIFCNLTLIGAGVDESAFGIVMPKNWLYAGNFDFTVLLLRESGVLNTLRKKWFDGTVCSDSDSSNDSTATTIDSLSGLFLIFGILLILSFFLHIWETRHEISNYILEWARRMKISKKKDEKITDHQITIYPNGCTEF